MRATAGVAHGEATAEPLQVLAGDRCERCVLGEEVGDFRNVHFGHGDIVAPAGTASNDGPLKSLEGHVAPGVLAARRQRRGSALLPVAG